MGKWGLMRKIVLLALALVLVLSGCRPEPPVGVTVDEDNSFLRDFEIDDGKVYFYCWITLESACDEDRWVELRAQSPEDVAGGLLESPEMFSSERFLVPAKGRVEYAEVTFVGQHGGGTTKLNRLLPDIIVVDVIL